MIKKELLEWIMGTKCQVDRLLMKRLHYKECSTYKRYIYINIVTTNESSDHRAHRNYAS